MSTFLIVPSAVVIVTASAYIYLVRTRISPILLHRITSKSSIPATLARSKAASIVNPLGHVTIEDTRSITLNISEDLSDEGILGSFVKGFFGGYVFAPERSILKALGKQITHFDALEKTPISSHTWSTIGLLETTPPPLHALLFGVFRVVERKITSAESYIDFAFGSSTGSLAGVHRFSVTRHSGTAVTIEFSHVGCNPREDKALKPEFLQTLHLGYAMLLFQEGVAKVMRV